jgi:preprotein translocase subunit SecA
VEEHMLAALELMVEARGLIEWDRMAAQGEVTLAMLDESRTAPLKEALGLEHYEELANLPLTEFSADDRAAVQREMGRYAQNEVYRDLLLHVISEQWVDYLTRVEALRVSIGLEAYAQRDPLVQYKSQASEMFKTLLSEIRLGVISRVFTYNTRRTALPQRVQAAPSGEAPAPEASAPATDGGKASGQAQSPAQPSAQRPSSQGGAQPGSYDPGGKKKRKRH